MSPSKQAAIRLLSLLAVGGILVAFYLVMLQWELSQSVFCPIGDCVLVNQSSYAYVFGIPVAVIGLVGYIVLLALSLAWQAHPERPALGLITALIATPGWLFSAYLTWAEFFAIEAICFWCLLSFALMTLFTAGAWFIHVRRSAPQT